MTIVDMCRREKELTISFQLNIDKWNTMDQHIKDMVSQPWENIKFLDETGTKINDKINKVPNDKGGVYVFLLKPEIIPGMHRYIMYIGRARKKNGFSLRKRCKEYLKDERIQIMYMRETWGDKLYFYYLPLDNDDDIEKIERELIRVIIPPCNTEIPDQYISFAQPTAAF